VLAQDGKSSLKGAWSGQVKFLILVGINHISGTAESIWSNYVNG